MAIIETITDTSKFYHWLQSSDNYKNNFSYEGANALQNYLDELSEDLGENIEFDPIAWCCEFNEYDSVQEAYKELVDGDEKTEADQLDYLEMNTVVIPTENNHIIVREF